MTDKIILVDCDLHLEKLCVQDSVKRSHDAIGYGGIFRRAENRIFINLGDIAKFTWDEDLINKICDTIMHEYMHKLLFNMIGAYTCTAFDNIANKFSEPGVM